jgi:hypothetical protein
MHVDYAYCETESCIHRRGYRRWVGNYVYVVHSEKLIDEVECRNEDAEDDSFPFIHLDRFRYSDGSSIK